MRLAPHNPLHRSSRKAPGFTLVEAALAVLIMSIIGVLCLNSVADFEASERADRAARETLACFRFARNLAMTTGKKAKVVIDTTNSTVSVFWQSNGATYDTTAYTTGLTATGTWVLNFTTSRELVGTVMSTTATTTGYTNYFEYSALGTCTPYTGTLKFTYAGRLKSLVIASVNDPALQ